MAVVIYYLIQQLERWIIRAFELRRDIGVISIL